MSDVMEPPVEIKRLLVQQEITLWTNTRYQLQLRYRVTKGVGGDTTAIEADLLNAEKALDLLSAELKALEDVK